MHVDRMPKAATTGEDAEDGPAGLEDLQDEIVSEARETTSVNSGKWKQQEKKPSGYFCNAYYVVLFYFFTQVAHARKATIR